MKFLLLLALFVLLSVITAQPAVPDDIKDIELDGEVPVGLLDVADIGDSHSNTAERNARYGYGGRGWGGGGWGGGGWGGGGWGGGGWGRRGWGGGGWGGGGWGRRGWGGGWG